MHFFQPSFCPLCAAENHPDRELEPVFAIAREDLASVNPMMPSIQHLQKIFEKSIIVDLAMCMAGHGLISLKTGQKVAT